MSGGRGPWRSWGLLGAVGALAWAQPFGCDVPDANPIDPDTTAVLANVGPGVVEPAVGRFVADAAALSDAIDAWAAAEDGPGDPALQAAAQDAWREAMATWQELEVLQIGPAASSLSAAGGQDLRDLIYSWPTVSRCRVDEELLGTAWQQDEFFVARNVNVLGLAALETLLFSEDGVTHCATAPEGWESWDAAGIRARRALYAVEAAEHLEATARALAEAWSPEGGDFSGLLAAAGTGVGPYATQGAALNAVLDALFYLEGRTKERKLARPLGLRDCAGEPCTAEVETTLAGGSHTWVAKNLVGFRALFTGGDGQGLDDLLVARGLTEDRDEVLAKLDAADAAAAAVTEPIDVAVTSRTAAVQALYDAVSALLAETEGDVATVLGLQVPEEAAGDND